jgi:hypothetical protein
MKLVTFKASALVVKKLMGHILDHEEVDELSVTEIPEPAAPSFQRIDEKGRPYRLSMNSKGLRSILEVGTNASIDRNSHFTAIEVRDHAVKEYKLSPKSISPALSIARINGLIERTSDGFRMTSHGRSMFGQMLQKE